MANGSRSSFYYGYVMVIVSLCIVVVAHGAQYTFGIFFKPLIDEFGWSRAAASGAFSLYMIIMGSLCIFVGRLADIFGPRLVVSVCGFLLGSGYILMAQTAEIWQLYLFYGIIIAAGMSGIWTPLVSTIPRWFNRKRGLMTGIVTSGTGFGTILLSLISSRLISEYGWRDAYLILGGFVLALVLLPAQFLKSDPRQVGQHPLGEGKEGRIVKAFAPEGFSLRETFRTGRFWMLCTTFFCFGFNLYSVMIHIVPHVIDLGISSVTAANIIVFIGGTNASGRILMGYAADRIGTRRTFVLSLAFMLAGFIWVMAAGVIWMFYVFAVVFGFGYGGMAVSMSAVPSELFGLKALGAIVGALMFSFTIGSSIGPVLAGHIFDVYRTYYPAFAICIAVSALGVVLSLLLPFGEEQQTGVL